MDFFVFIMGSYYEGNAEYVLIKTCFFTVLFNKKAKKRREIQGNIDKITENAPTYLTKSKKNAIISLWKVLAKLTEKLPII